jgi:aminopeptidase N
MRSAVLLGILGLLAACSSPSESPTGSGGSDTGGSGGAGASGSSSSGAGGTGGEVPLPTGPITGAVTRYDYAFDLASRHARSSLTVDVAPPGGDCFHVSSELPAVINASWNGAPAASAVVQGGALDACGPGVQGGAPLVIEAEVDVPAKTFFGLDVGFSKSKDQDGGDFTYLLSWVGGCDRFGPCDDDPSRLAAFHFEVTHPSGTVVLCPGVLTAGDTKTTCDLTGTLAPTYSAFGIAADPLWKRTLFGNAAGVDLVFYETPTGQIASTLEPLSVNAFVQWITTLLGPFPYGGEIRFAGAPTLWLGFEHPANIVLHEDLPSFNGAYSNATMHVLMHEVAHQWAGDFVTLATPQDFVWKEATAEYLSYVFEDEQRPPDEAASSLSYWDGISLQSDHYPRPTDDPPPSVQSFYGDVYGPGPMVLYVQLESMFGRPAVLDGIKSFLAQPGARSVVDLQGALSASSGQDLTAYFDAWVFGQGKPEWPTFEIATAQAGDQVTVTVTQKNASGKVYGCKVEVQVDGASTSALAAIDFGPSPQSATASATVTLAEPVIGTKLDPNHRVVGRLASAPLTDDPPLPVWPL